MSMQGAKRVCVLSQQYCPLQVVSRDPVAISLAKKHQVDVVISSSGMNCLLNNHPPDYRQQWQVPITVQLRGMLLILGVWRAWPI